MILFFTGLTTNPFAVPLKTSPIAKAVHFAIFPIHLVSSLPTPNTLLIASLDLVSAEES